MKAYGLVFPSDVTPLTIELKCARMNHPPDRGGLGMFGHLVKAHNLILGGQGGFKKLHEWNPWTERRMREWCEDRYHPGDSRFITWWGPSSSGKTCDAAGLALLYWLMSPHDTIVTVCSTTGNMLRDRVWGEIERAAREIQDILPGAIKSSTMRIKSNKGKGSIRGIAIQQGSAEQAKNNIYGVHGLRNMIIIDEMQSVRLAILEALPNLATGEEFRFLGMGNPESRLDPLGEYSKPIGGWKTIDPEQPGNEAWETRRGKTLWFDGLKSPAIAEPKKYPFLLNADQIEEVRRIYGGNSPKFWSQRRGFIPPDSLRNVVMPETMADQFGLQDEPRFTSSTVKFLACDPAWSNDGDNPVIRIGYVGQVDGRRTIGLVYHERVQLQIREDRTVAYFLRDAILDRARQWDVPFQNIGIDTTGAQFILADMLDERTGEQVHRWDSRSAPTDNPLNAAIPYSARDQFESSTAEAWFRVREFARSRQLKGMNLYELAQYASRLVTHEGKTGIEGKKKYRARNMGDSPDDGDALAILVQTIVKALGFLPAGGDEEIIQAQNGQLDDDDEMPQTDDPDEIDRRDSWQREISMGGYV